MAFNFPEVWVNRVIKLLTTLNVANWLDGIAELDTEILEVGSNAASEQNIIHLPIENFQPEVLINNTTYPIGLQAFDDTTATIQLDKYQTKVTTLSDDQIMGASYARIDSATRGHVTQITSKKYQKAIHAIAPAENTSKTPVLKLSDFGLDVYKSLVAMKAEFDKNEVPLEGRRVVLCPDHFNALLNDRERFANLLSNMNTGGVAPMIAGFEIYQYVGMPTYKANAKKAAWAAIPTAGDVPASVAFHKDNIAKKTGLTKQYFSPASADPEGQTNKINYRHYFIALPAKNEAIGAIIGTAGVAVAGIGIVNAGPLALDINEVTQLELAFAPAHASNQGVIFTSSDAAVASVSANGLVTGLTTGTATITVTTVEGNFTATISVGVDQ